MCPRPRISCSARVCGLFSPTLHFWFLVSVRCLYVPVLPGLARPSLFVLFGLGFVSIFPIAFACALFLRRGLRF